MDICLGDNLRFDNECNKLCYTIFSNKKINDILLVNFSPLKVDKIVDETIYFSLREEQLSKLFHLFEIIDEKVAGCLRIKKINMGKFKYVPVKSLLITEDKYLRLTFNPRGKSYKIGDTINCVFWIKKLIIEEKEDRVFPLVILY